jgi:hypothetical protein
VQRLKLALKDKAPKTVNNVLTVLSITLKKAVEWDVIERLPCTIRLLQFRNRRPRFMTSTSTSSWSTPLGRSIGRPI